MTNSLRQLLGAMSILVSICAGGTAYGRADTHKFYREGDFVKCVSIQNGWDRAELLLEWDQRNRYQRQVSAIALKFPHQSCENWRFLRLEYDQRASVKTLEAWKAKMSPDLLAQLQLELDWIAKGGQRTRAGDVAAWLDKEQLTTRAFTIDDNRKAAKEHGVAFARQVYTAWTLAQPGNAEINDEFTANLRTDFVPGNENPSQMIVLVARELGFSDVDGTGKLWPFIEDIKSLGFEVEAMKTTPYGTVRENAGVIRTRLQYWAELGREVILVGASKGSTDMIHAISDPALSQNAKKSIVGVINISGVVGGSIFADILDPWWLRRLFDQLLRATHFFNSKQPVKSVNAFNDLRSRTLKRLLKPAAEGGLPEGALYLNIVGTPGETGLAVDKSMRDLQLKFIKKYKDSYGANDGYVEFPANEIPLAWTPHSKNFTIFLDSSHVLVDGGPSGMKITDPADRKRFVGALLRAVLDRR